MSGPQSPEFTQRFTSADSARTPFLLVQQHVTPTVADVRIATYILMLTAHDVLTICRKADSRYPRPTEALW
jgi:hypothetical protein